MNKITLSRKDLESFATHSLGFSRKALRRMSTLFLGQLFRMQLDGDNTLYQMAHEVRCLERYRLSVSHGNDHGDDYCSTMNKWVIYRRHNGTNYYLTLARLDDGDLNIRQRVRHAYDFDFPYLRGNA